MAVFDRPDITDYCVDPAHRDAYIKEFNVKQFSYYQTNNLERRPVALRGFIKAVSEQLKFLQVNGTCVGQGWALAATCVMAVEAVMGFRKYPGRAAVAGTYTFSRVEIGGRPGRWEGSTGSWAAAAVVKKGVVLMKDLGLGENDYTKDEQLAMQWTANQQGVPAELEAVAGKRTIVETPLIRTVDEARNALLSNCPVIVAGTLIPTGQRDSRGISPMRAAGGHCVAITGYDDKTDSFVYDNSWPDSWASGPLPDFMLPNQVRITASDMQSIINQQDTYAAIGAMFLESR